MAIAIAATIEGLMCRKLGTLKLVAPNSKGVFDIYTLSHIIHGIILYAIFIGWLKLPFQLSLILAVAIECSWEIFENTPFVIGRYRKTVSIHYQGDTIINSISDILCMIAGFCVVSSLPLLSIIMIIITFELVALYWVRDNLILNVVMLIYPFQCIKRWQLDKEK